MSVPTGLPSNWEVRHSNSKNLPYYFNPSTRESCWEPPPDTNSEQLKVYMGMFHSNSSQPVGMNGNSAATATTTAADAKIRAAHLLVKHAESRRPASWREAKIMRTKADARQIIAAHEARIQSGEVALGDLAVQESDCSSARKRGDLGYFGRGDMQREFEEAAFNLRVGEVSGIVETASGLHLIERLA